jgi:hypothetical protein
MAVAEEDRRVMGSPEAAEAALKAKAAEWRKLRQPLMANAAQQRNVEREEQQVRFELANAALLWLWHQENPAIASSEAA